MKRSYIGFQVTLVVMFVILAGQLYRMQIIEGKSYADRATDNRERVITKKAERGIIYDRNGMRLVANNPSYSVAITPADLPDATTASGEVARTAVFANLAGILK